MPPKKPRPPKNIIIIEGVGEMCREDLPNNKECIKRKGHKGEHTNQFNLWQTILRALTIC